MEVSEQARKRRMRNDSKRQILKEIIAAMEKKPKRRPGRPKAIHTLLAEGLAAQAAITVQTPESEGGAIIKYIPAPAEALKEWAAGQLLQSKARQVIGRGIDVVDQTLAAGKELIPGITPPIALDKSLSPSMLRVAGYQDGPAAQASIQLVNLIAPQPGAASAGPALLDLVRESDVFALPSANTSEVDADANLESPSASVGVERSDVDKGAKYEEK